MSRYRHYAGVSLHNSRRTWIWTDRKGDHVYQASKEHVMDTSKYFVELLPDDSNPDVLDRLNRFFRGYRKDLTKRQDMDWLTEAPGVEEVHRGNGYVIYRLPPRT